MKTKILYYLVYSLLYTFSLLPMWFLYGISNGLYLVVFYVWKYRRKLAFENLKRAFPEKADQEIWQIMKQNYLYLTDMMVEYIKSISISKTEIEKRFVVRSPESWKELKENEKGSILLGTHYGNFEWLVILVSAGVAPKKGYGVYSGLTNPVFEKIVVKTRERWGGELMPMKAAIVSSMKKLQTPCVIGFICDQSPYSPQESYFTQLFGIETAVHHRFADLILRAEATTYFLHIERPKRGHYTLDLIPMPLEGFLPYSDPNAKRFVEWYNQLLENNIRQNPAYWLWTHRRWKHSPQK